MDGITKESMGRISEEATNKQKAKAVVIGLLLGVILTGMIMLIYSRSYNASKEAAYEKAMTEYYNSKIN